VRVQVSRVDLDGRRIDFRLVHEGEVLTQRTVKEKPGFIDISPFESDVRVELRGRKNRKVPESSVRLSNKKPRSPKLVARPEAGNEIEKIQRPRRRS
jgi:ribonuclease R